VPSGSATNQPQPTTEPDAPDATTPTIQTSTPAAAAGNFVTREEAVEHAEKGGVFEWIENGCRAVNVYCLIDGEWQWSSTVVHCIPVESPAFDLEPGAFRLIPIDTSDAAGSATASGSDSDLTVAGGGGDL
jgi:hypothetical protein